MTNEVQPPQEPGPDLPVEQPDVTSTGNRFASWLFATVIVAAVSVYVALNWDAVIPKLMTIVEAFRS